MVYIWNREASQTNAAPPPQAIVSSPLMLPPGPYPTLNSGPPDLPARSPPNGLTPPPGQYGLVTPVNKSSPAYYPPRGMQSAPSVNTVGGGTTVKPLKLLEGHGSGAVFEVKSFDGQLMSAGEDGSVVIWDEGETTN